MKIKELRLVNVSIKNEGKLIYEGKVENIPSDLVDKDCASIELENGIINIEI